MENLPVVGAALGMVLIAAIVVAIKVLYLILQDLCVQISVSEPPPPITFVPLTQRKESTKLDAGIAGFIPCDGYSGEVDNC